jgi:hypothetical protein
MLSDPSVTILMYFVLPVWFIAGFAFATEQRALRQRVVSRNRRFTR